MRSIYLSDGIQELESIFKAIHFGKVYSTDRITYQFKLSTSYGDTLRIDDLIKAYHKLSGDEK